MPIPKTRQELSNLLESSFSKLRRELDTAGPQLVQLQCVDDWSVKDLLAVRAWWTEKVADWIEAGRRGELPVLPAPGYSWQETPRLNADIIKSVQSKSFSTIRTRLEQGYKRILAIIDVLDDRELLEVGVFDWAGKWPIARWISINTARQYTTAYTFIRKARKRSRQ